MAEAAGPKADPQEGSSDLWGFVPPMRQEPGLEEEAVPEMGVR